MRLKQTSINSSTHQKASNHISNLTNPTYEDIIAVKFGYCLIRFGNRTPFRLSSIEFNDLIKKIGLIGFCWHRLVYGTIIFYLRFYMSCQSDGCWVTPIVLSSFFGIRHFKVCKSGKIQNFLADLKSVSIKVRLALQYIFSILSEINPISVFIYSMCVTSVQG